MKGPKFNQLAVLVIAAFILAAHAAAFVYFPQFYDWRKNAISDLAAQQYRLAWIARFGFYVFGVILCSGITRKFIAGKGRWSVDIPIFVFGASVFIAGVFNVKPLFPAENYSQVSATLHSFFATLTGFAISSAIFFHPFPLSGEKKRIAVIDFAFLALVVGFSVLFDIAESTSSPYTGVVQRLIWLTGLTWLALVYNSSPKSGLKTGDP